jgi:hypothetical protein
MDIDLSASTPEDLQVVNTGHLVWTEIQTVQTSLAQIVANEVGGARHACESPFRPISACFQTGSDQYRLWAGSVPKRHNLAVAHDRGDRIVDELSLPSREWLVGVFGGRNRSTISRWPFR